MNISFETKIHDLLATYPFLEDFLVARNSRYKNLKNPLMRNTIGRVATIKQVAGVGGEDAAELIASLRQEVDRRSREGFQAFVGKKFVDPEKQEKLKGIILALHAGDDLEMLKKRFAALAEGVTATEIADLEQSLIDDGMPEQEVRRLCDLHVALFEESLEPHAVPDMPPGHPVHTFMLENRAAEQVIEHVKVLLGEFGAPPDLNRLLAERGRLAPLLEELGAVAIHYTRKENQLFPLLEQHGVTGPSKVMWGIHDNIRAQLKQVRVALDHDRPEEMHATLVEAVKAIAGMIYKEEHILFPMSLDILSREDWDRVRQGEEAIGYAWIEPPDAGGERQPRTPQAAPAGKFEMQTGYAGSCPDQPGIHPSASGYLAGR